MARPPMSLEEVEEFRERLCDTAMAMFAEQGFNAVTMRALAAELGCSYTTPYRYFNDKHAIFVAVRERCFERFGVFLQARLTGAESPGLKCRRLFAGYLAFADSQPAAFRVIFQLEQPDDDDYADPDSSGGKAWTLFYGAVEAWVASGDIEGEPLKLAHLFWAALHGIVSLDLAGRLAWGMSADEISEPMLDALIRAHSPKTFQSEETHR
jgi:AcrR family transcriptional regulator